MFFFLCYYIYIYIFVTALVPFRSTKIGNGLFVGDEGTQRRTTMTRNSRGDAPAGQQQITTALFTKSPHHTDPYTIIQSFLFITLYIYNMECGIWRILIIPTHQRQQQQQEGYSYHDVVVVSFRRV